MHSLLLLILSLILGCCSIEHKLERKISLNNNMMEHNYVLQGQNSQQLNELNKNDESYSDQILKLSLPQEYPQYTPMKSKSGILYAKSYLGQDQNTKEYQHQKLNHIQLVAYSPENNLKHGSLDKGHPSSHIYVALSNQPIVHTTVETSDMINNNGQILKNNYPQNNNQQDMTSLQLFQPNFSSRNHLRILYPNNQENQIENKQNIDNNQDYSAVGHNLEYISYIPQEASPDISYMVSAISSDSVQPLIAYEEDNSPYLHNSIPGQQIIKYMPSYLSVPLRQSYITEKEQQDKFENDKTLIETSMNPHDILYAKNKDYKYSKDQSKQSKYAPKHLEQDIQNQSHLKKLQYLATHRAKQFNDIQKPKKNFNYQYKSIMDPFGPINPNAKSLLDSYIPSWVILQHQ